MAVRRNACSILNEILGLGSRFCPRSGGGGLGLLRVTREDGSQSATTRWELGTSTITSQSLNTPFLCVGVMTFGRKAPMLRRGFTEQVLLDLLADDGKDSDITVGEPYFTAGLALYLAQISGLRSGPPCEVTL